MDWDSIRKKLADGAQTNYSPLTDGDADDAPSNPISPDTPESDDDSSSSMNPVLQQHLSDLAQLQQAQQQSKQNMTGAGLTAALAQITHGISRAPGQADLSGAQALQQTANQPVANVLAQQKIGDQVAASTRSSDIADKLRDVYKPILQRAGMDPSSLDGMDADEIKEFTQNPLEAMDRINQRREQAEQRAQTANIANQNRATAEQGRSDDRAAKSQDAAMSHTVDGLESARGNPAIQQAEKDIYAASKVNSLANLYGDPNKLNPQMVKTLVSEVGKIASGGQSSEAELDALTPDTLSSKLAGVWQPLKNEPSPANAAAFVKQYQDYANALTADAQKMLTDKYGRIIDSRSDALGEANVSKLKDKYLNRFGSVTPPANSHPNASQAMKWAQDNPNDPRAKAILQRLGGMGGGAPL